MDKMVNVSTPCGLSTPYNTGIVLGAGFEPLMVLRVFRFSIIVLQSMPFPTQFPEPAEICWRLAPLVGFQI